MYASISNIYMYLLFAEARTKVITCLGEFSCATQQTCLVSDTADMSAASHRSYVCCVTQQTCLLCHTTDVSAL